MEINNFGNFQWANPKHRATHTFAPIFHKTWYAVILKKINSLYLTF